MEDKWGGKLIHLVGRADSLMDEILDATGRPFRHRRSSGLGMSWLDRQACSATLTLTAERPGLASPGMMYTEPVGTSVISLAAYFVLSGCSELCAAVPEVAWSVTVKPQNPKNRKALKP